VLTFGNERVRRVAPHPTVDEALAAASRWSPA
jgi:hypothetical protein